MKRKTVRKIRAGVKAILTVLNSATDWMLIPSKSETLRRLRKMRILNPGEEYWREYYASSVRDGVERLTRKGIVEVRETGQGIEVRIINKGKTEVVRAKLDELRVVQSDKWDGKWRMVFFDVAEVERGKRDLLRDYLMKMGLKQMQKSVFVTPYDCERDVKFLREVVGVPHGVKLVTAEKIENDGDLREWFDL